MIHSYKFYIVVIPFDTFTFTISFYRYILIRYRDDRVVVVLLRWPFWYSHSPTILMPTYRYSSCYSDLHLIHFRYRWWPYVVVHSVIHWCHSIPMTTIIPGDILLLFIRIPNYYIPLTIHSMFDGGTFLLPSSYSISFDTIRPVIHSFVYSWWYTVTFVPILIDDTFGLPSRSDSTILPLLHSFSVPTIWYIPLFHSHQVIHHLHWPIPTIHLSFPVMMHWSTEHCVGCRYTQTAFTFIPVLIRYSHCPLPSLTILHSVDTFDAFIPTFVVHSDTFSMIPIQFCSILPFYSFLPVLHTFIRLTFDVWYSFDHSTCSWPVVDSTVLFDHSTIRISFGDVDHSWYHLTFWYHSTFLTTFILLHYSTFDHLPFTFWWYIPTSYIHSRYILFITFIIRYICSLRCSLLFSIVLFDVRYILFDDHSIHFIYRWLFHSIRHSPFWYICYSTFVVRYIHSCYSFICSIPLFLHHLSPTFYHIPFVFWSDHSMLLFTDDIPPFILTVLYIPLFHSHSIQWWYNLFILIPFDYHSIHSRWYIPVTFISLHSTFIHLIVHSMHFVDTFILRLHLLLLLFIPFILFVLFHHHHVPFHTLFCVTVNFTLFLRCLFLPGDEFLFLRYYILFYCSYTFLHLPFYISAIRYDAFDAIPVHDYDCSLHSTRFRLPLHTILPRAFPTPTVRYSLPIPTTLPTTCDTDAILHLFILLPHVAFLLQYISLFHHCSVLLPPHPLLPLFCCSVHCSIHLIYHCSFLSFRYSRFDFDLLMVFHDGLIDDHISRRWATTWYIPTIRWVHFIRSHLFDPTHSLFHCCFPIPFPTIRWWPLFCSVPVHSDLSYTISTFPVLLLLMNILFRAMHFSFLLFYLISVCYGDDHYSRPVHSTFDSFWHSHCCVQSDDHSYGDTVHIDTLPVPFHLLFIHFVRCSFPVPIPTILCHSIHSLPFDDDTCCYSHLFWPDALLHSDSPFILEAWRDYTFVSPSLVPFVVLLMEVMMPFYLYLRWCSFDALRVPTLRAVVHRWLLHYRYRCLEWNHTWTHCSDLPMRSVVLPLRFWFHHDAGYSVHLFCSWWCVRSFVQFPPHSPFWLPDTGVCYIHYHLRYAHITFYHSPPPTIVHFGGNSVISYIRCCCCSTLPSFTTTFFRNGWYAHWFSTDTFLYHSPHSIPVFYHHHYIVDDIPLPHCVVPLLMIHSTFVTIHHSIHSFIRYSFIPDAIPTDVVHCSMMTFISDDVPTTWWKFIRFYSVPLTDYRWCHSDEFTGVTDTGNLLSTFCSSRYILLMTLFILFHCSFHCLFYHHPTVVLLIRYVVLRYVLTIDVRCVLNLFILLFVVFIVDVPFDDDTDPDTIPFISSTIFIHSIVDVRVWFIPFCSTDDSTHSIFRYTCLFYYIPFLTFVTSPIPHTTISVVVGDTTSTDYIRWRPEFLMPIHSMLHSILFRHHLDTVEAMPVTGGWFTGTTISITIDTIPTFVLPFPVW